MSRWTRPNAARWRPSLRRKALLLAGLRRVALLRLALLLVALPLVTVPSWASAQAPRPVDDLVHVSLSVGEQPHLLHVTVAADEAVDVILDRRVLRLTFQPTDARRRYRCRHPDAPRRNPRRGALERGETWTEWVDLRMLCWSARDHLSEGGTLRGTYGLRGRRRGREVAVTRGPETEERRQLRVDAPELVIPPVDSSPAAAPSTASQGASPEEPDEASPVVLTLSDADARSEAGVTFRVRLRSEVPARAYLRDDLLAFDVSGPLGTVRCEVPQVRIGPIADFYRRIGARRSIRTSIEAERWCPEDTFLLPGIYEVTPIVDLVYDGERYERITNVVTGTYQGQPSLVRIRRGGARGYVEHLVENGS